MGKRFKVGDVIFVEKCLSYLDCGGCDLGKFCIGHVTEIFEIAKNKKRNHYYIKLYNNENGRNEECYVTYKEIRRATNREEFLYKIYGPIIPGEHDEKKV